MGKRFLRLSALGAALTANGLRPMPHANPLAMPSFVASWLTSELAPQNLAITIAGSAAYVASKRGRLDRRDRIALALNAGSVVGLGALVRQALQVHGIVEDALAEGLGNDWAARLDPSPPGGGRGAAGGDLTTPWRQVLTPWQTKHPDVKRIGNVAYANPRPGARKRRNLLDIYRPREGGSKLPVLLQIHGGAWVIGEKEQQGLPLMNHMAARGWVCVAPNYPLSPQSAWPEHLIACKQALAWIRDNIEEYGGDPDFVAVTGGSAGGHLAAMVALTPNDPAYQPGFEAADTSVAACVPFYGAYDLANLLGTKAGEREYRMFLAPTVFNSRDRDAAVAASPLRRVRPDAPPCFVIHGARDSLVNVAEARELVRRLREANDAPVVYAELPGAQHAFDVFASVRSAHVIRAVERFLRWAHLTRNLSATSAAAAHN